MTPFFSNNGGKNRSGSELSATSTEGKFDTKKPLCIGREMDKIIVIIDKKITFGESIDSD